MKLFRYINFRRNVLLGLVVVLSAGTTGCWNLRWFERGGNPGGRWGSWGLERVAVVRFADATSQSLGEAVARSFALVMGDVLGGSQVVRPDVITGSGFLWVGFLGVGQLRELGQAQRVTGVLTGKVLAAERQRLYRRDFLHVSLRLMDARTGVIVWSRGVHSVQEYVDTQAETRDFTLAIEKASYLAAKEFIHDLFQISAGTVFRWGPRPRGVIGVGATG